jgi:hypothetical protein
MLIADLGYHALAVEIAGAALHASEGLQSISEFRKELASPTSDELELAAELAGMLPTGHEKSIASTLIRSIERLGVKGAGFLTPCFYARCSSYTCVASNCCFF